MSIRLLAPTGPRDRFDVYRFFNGLSAEAKEGMDVRHARVPMVKTFLLEHVGRRGNGRPKPPAAIFHDLGADVQMLDDDFMALAFVVKDPQTQHQSMVTTGFIEQYDQRFFAYYTSEKAEDASKRVARWVQAPDLDHAWFSSPLLQVLWLDDVSLRGDQFFGKLVFRHESIFEMPEDFAAEGIGPEETTEEEPTEEEEPTGGDRVEVERRKARFEMGDGIGKIRQALSALQANYSPLHALHALRLPSRTARGGHELYQIGRITNRTDSFEDHRNTVRYLWRIYGSILDFTEEVAWHEISRADPYHVGMKGVPLVVEFAEPLTEATFNRWAQMAFQKRNRFRLWGDPIRLGPTKVHVYGADRHLWQPINLELTSKGLVAILPQGTCGNTFHRLITNIQHYVCPEIRAWVGSVPFDQVVRKWPAHAEEAHER